MLRTAIWISLLVLLTVWTGFGLWRAAIIEGAQQTLWVFFSLLVIVLLCLVTTAMFQQARIDFWEQQFRRMGKVSVDQMHNIYLEADFSLSRSFSQVFAGLCVAAGFYLTFIDPQNPTEIEFSLSFAHGKARTDVPAMMLLMLGLLLVTMLAFANRDRRADVAARLLSARDPRPDSDEQS